MQRVLQGCLLVASIIGLGMIQGCATMNQSECQSANWQIIGLEDGSAGRATSYIGEHRSACAEYGISPDLEAYLNGHAQGLKQYCSYESGYSLGERGSGYNQVCIASQYPEFGRGYQRGKVAYGYLSEMRRLEHSIQAHVSRLTEIEKLIKHKEDRLLADGTTLEERRDLLEAVKTLNTEISEINIELPILEAELNEVERRYERFRQQK